MVSNNPISNIFSADFGYNSGPNTGYGNGGNSGNSLGGWNMNSLFNMGGGQQGSSPYSNFDPFSVMGLNSNYGTNTYQSSNFSMPNSSGGSNGGIDPGYTNSLLGDGGGIDPNYTSSLFSGAVDVGSSSYQSLNSQYGVGGLLASLGVSGAETTQDPSAQATNLPDLSGLGGPSVGGTPPSSDYTPSSDGSSPPGGYSPYTPAGGSPPAGYSPYPPASGSPPAGSPPSNSPPAGSPPSGSPPSSGPSGPLFSGGKEGLGVSDTSSNGDGSNLGNTKASWYYDWSPNASSKVNDPNAQFIPMIWGAKDMNPDALKAAKDSSSPMLLTFNEPDLASQGNMSVDEALSHWDQLEATGKKLSSPAVSNGPDGVKWLDDFMSKAQAQGRQVDSISLHWYGSSGSSTQQNLDAMKAYIDQVHQKYPDKPINLTEFGVDASGLTANKDPAFLAGAEKMLNGMDYVQMYAPYGTGDIKGNQ